MMADQRSEPSMEAILASIKKIIADEDRGGIPATPRRATRTAPVRDPEESNDILELTQIEVEDVDDAEEELLDDGKAQSLRQSFSVLQTLTEPGVAPQIVRSGETSLEGMVRDMLRPMLKDWLDSNLPNIVEAMVAREIERITKKG